MVPRRGTDHVIPGAADKSSFERQKQFPGAAAPYRGGRFVSRPIRIGREPMKPEKPSTSLSIIITTAISIVALCLSGAAYWNTIVTQREDREYRELSIRPSLAHLPEATNYTVTIKNRGLGPAVIKRITGFAAGQCIELDPKHKTDATWRFQTEHLIPFFLDRLGFALTFAGIKLDFRIRTRFQMPSVGATIPKDDELIIFAFDEEDTAMLKKLVREHRAETEISSAFILASRAIPLAMEYCSVTGKYCYNEDTKGSCLRRI
jgi:hypothetical protein